MRRPRPRPRAVTLTKSERGVRPSCDEGWRGWSSGAELAVHSHAGRSAEEEQWRVVTSRRGTECKRSSHLGPTGRMGRAKTSRLDGLAISNKDGVLSGRLSPTVWIVMQDSCVDMIRFVHKYEPDESDASSVFCTMKSGVICGHKRPTRGPMGGLNRGPTHASLL